MIKTKGNYSISDDSSKLDLDIIHDYLSNKAYWSKNIPKNVVQKSIEHSHNFGVYYLEKQIGYARVVTDYATIAYLGDVFILPEYQRNGLGEWLVESVMNHPDLQGFRRWILLTGDAHELYKKFGWNPITNIEKWMEISRSPKQLYK